jgi:hypothetical protein
MPTRGGDLQRASRAREPAHVSEVDGLVVQTERIRPPVGRWRRVRPFRLALQAGAQLRDAAGGTNLYALHERGLGDVGSGHDHATDPGGAEGIDEREHAGHRTDRAVETELAEHPDAVEDAVGELARRRHETERDRELEPRAGLANPAGREVDGDPLLRELELRREQRGPDPFTRLADRGVRQSHDVIAGQTGRHVDLDGHDVTVDTGERGAANRGEHGRPPEKRGEEGRDRGDLDGTSTVPRAYDGYARARSARSPPRRLVTCLHGWGEVRGVV